MREKIKNMLGFASKDNIKLGNIEFAPGKLKEAWEENASGEFLSLLPKFVEDNTGTLDQLSGLVYRKDVEILEQESALKIKKLWQLPKAKSLLKRFNAVQADVESAKKIINAVTQMAGRSPNESYNLQNSMKPEVPYSGNFE